MPRTKGALNKKTIAKQQAAAAAGGIGHNSGDVQGLDDKQQMALHHGNHVPAYKKAMDAKKTAAADFLNVCKMIKAEGGSIAEVKRTMELQQSAGGEKQLEADIQQLIKIARWNNLKVGMQADMFGSDIRPLAERAKEEGVIAGMAGKIAKPPYDDHEAAQKWLEGHHEGQAVLAARIKPTKDSNLIQSEENRTAGPDQFDGDDEGASTQAGGDATAQEEWPDDAAAKARKAGQQSPLN